MQFEEKIIEQVKHISDSWDNFKQDYKDTKSQLQQLQTAFNRPIMVDDNISYMEKGLCVDYLRKGEIKLELKEHFSSSAEGGGGLMMPSLSRDIVTNVHSISPIRQLASTETISSHELDIIVEESEFEAKWAAETVERSITKTPRLVPKKIAVHDLYAQPMATQKLIDDSSIDIYAWISQRLSENFARTENYAFINGDGINKPKGILADEKIEVIKSTEESKIKIDDILALINSLSEYYIANASFLMHRSTLSYIQSLKDDSGRFIWQPSYHESRPQTLFGIPLYCCDDMPAINQEGFAIVLGDLKKGYKIVDRQGIFIMRDPYTHKPFVKFYAIKRVGADVINSSAIKLLRR